VEADALMGPHPTVEAARRAVAKALRAADARGYKRAQDELLDAKDTSQRPIVIDTRLTMRALRIEPEATTDEMYGQSDGGAT
jgi:hypothetical protein